MKALLLSIICRTAQAAQSTKPRKIVCKAIQRTYDALVKEKSDQEDKSITEEDMIEKLKDKDLNPLVQDNWAHWAFALVGAGEEIRRLLFARNRIMQNPKITEEQRQKIDANVGGILKKGDFKNAQKNSCANIQ